MEKDFMEQFKLSKEMHDSIYKRIESEVFRNSEKEKNPVAIIVGGQPGCGKGAVIAYSKKQIENANKDVVIITTDEYKPYHPDAIEIAKKYPTEYVKIIEQDAGLWTGEILKKAIEDKHNFIFEGTLKNNRILERIKELKQNGFKVVVRALAVPRLESLISVHERYQNQIDNIGLGRLISVDHHNTAYKGIPKVIDEIEKSGLCTVEIYKRGKKINEPERIYSSKMNEKRFPSARNALEECRRIEEYKTKVTAKARIEVLKQAYKDRNATEDEMNEIELIEKYTTIEHER
ncbi:MAG: zeta toxin family protein [Clostridia bacterium]|nr:zeta toxin family protein [Clostridia bacterium]